MIFRNLRMVGNSLETGLGMVVSDFWCVRAGKISYAEALMLFRLVIMNHSPSLAGNKNTLQHDGGFPAGTTHKYGVIPT